MLQNEFINDVKLKIEKLYSSVDVNYVNLIIKENRVLIDAIEIIYKDQRKLIVFDPATNIIEDVYKAISKIISKS